MNDPHEIAEADIDSEESDEPITDRYDKSLISLVGKTVTYIGEEPYRTAAFMERHKITEKHFYVSFLIVNIEQDANLSLGLCANHTPLNQHIGLLKDSIGIHTSDKYLYACGYKVELALKQTIQNNDQIGFGINYSKCYVDYDGPTAWVYYTHNGDMIGCQAIGLPEGGFFPAIGLSSSKEEVLVEKRENYLPTDPNDVLETYIQEDENWSRLDDVVLHHNYLHYNGQANSMLDVGFAQARNCLTPSNHFFEIEITNPGQDCYIAIGLTPCGYPTHNHPGWVTGSIGYHADDGNLYCGSTIGEEFGPACSTGDRMGCGIFFPDECQIDLYGVVRDTDSDKPDTDEDDKDTDMQYVDLSGCDDKDDKESKWLLENEHYRDLEEVSEVRVYFTHNGSMLGERSIKMPKHGLFPTVGMLSDGEVVLPILNGVTG